MPKRVGFIIASGASHEMTVGKRKRGLTLAEQVEVANKRAIAIRKEREEARRKAEKERIERR